MNADTCTIEHGDIRRGATTVLRAHALQLPSNGIAGLVGINGAGKSTLMLEVADVLRHSRNASVRGTARTTSRNTNPAAYSPQRPSFPGWLNGVEIARMFGLEYDALEAAYPALLLEELRRSRGNTLSVGQAQALSIALALYADTAITLLDEPFAPLDFRRRIALSQILQERRAAHAGLVLISSQSASELIDVCDWLIVLHGGTYVHNGPISDITDGSENTDDARTRLERHVLALI